MRITEKLRRLGVCVKRWKNENTTSVCRIFVKDQGGRCIRYIQAAVVFRGLEWALALISLVMTVVNWFTAEYLLLGFTLAFSAASLLNILLLHVSFVNDKLVYGLFAAESNGAAAVLLYQRRAKWLQCSVDLPDSELCHADLWCPGWQCLFGSGAGDDAVLFWCPAGGHCCSMPTRMNLCCAFLSCTARSTAFACCLSWCAARRRRSLRKPSGSIGTCTATMP